MQKILHFTHFDPINTHINGCKIVHKCAIATVTVHICTVNVALAFNILVIFSFSLSLVAHSHLTLPFSHFIKSSNHLISRWSKRGSRHHHQSKCGYCLWISRCLMVLISGFLVGSSNHPISRRSRVLVVWWISLVHQIALISHLSVDTPFCNLHLTSHGG